MSRPLRRIRQANALVWRTVDWRYIGAVAGAGLVAVVIASLITQADARREADARASQALAAQTESRQAATRRIDLLQQRIIGLEDDVAFSQAQNAEANTKLDAALEQLRQLGARPVVSPSSSVRTTPTTTPSQRPSTSTTTSPASPSSPTTTAPPSTTTTQPPRPCTTRPILGCLPTDS